MLSPMAVPRPNVLVVDDEASICEAIAEALPDVAGKIAIANSTARALSVLASDPFDVVVCDFYMPGGGGLELLATSFSIAMGCWLCTDDWQAAGR